VTASTVPDRMFSRAHPPASPPIQRATWWGACCRFMPDANTVQSCSQPCMRQRLLPPLGIALGGLKHFRSRPAILSRCMPAGELAHMLSKPLQLHRLEEKDLT
jgi:hypothetical protein